MQEEERIRNVVVVVGKERKRERGKKKAVPMVMVSGSLDCRKERIHCWDIRKIERVCDFATANRVWD